MSQEEFLFCFGFCFCYHFTLLRCWCLFQFTVYVIMFIFLTCYQPFLRTPIICSDKRPRNVKSYFWGSVFRYIPMLKLCLQYIQVLNSLEDEKNQTFPNTLAWKCSGRQVHMRHLLAVLPSSFLFACGTLTKMHCEQRENFLLNFTSD